MTPFEWKDYRDLHGEPCPAVHERFADPTTPDADGLRLYAEINGKWYTAQIRGRTVVAACMLVEHWRDVTVEWRAPERKESALDLMRWLRNLGWSKTWALPMPRREDAAAAAYAEIGES